MVHLTCTELEAGMVFFFSPQNYQVEFIELQTLEFWQIFISGVRHANIVPLVSLVLLVSLIFSAFFIIIIFM